MFFLGPYAAVVHDEFTTRSLWYYLFGGLWNNAFISGVNQFIIAVKKIKKKYIHFSLLLLCGITLTKPIIYTLQFPLLFTESLDII